MVGGVLDVEASEESAKGMIDGEIIQKPSWMSQEVEYAHQTSAYGEDGGKMHAIQVCLHRYQHVIWNSG